MTSTTSTRLVPTVPAPPGGAPAPAPAIAWHALPGEEAVRRLGSGPGGLAPAEAAARLARHGPNAVAREGGPGPLVLFLRQLNDPIAYLLLASGALAIGLGKLTDGLVVLGAILVNAVIGFMQEHRAGKAIAALSRLVPELATVRRGGEQRQVPAAELVPGDVVLVASGDRVPADARVLEARQLQVEEAALTGESLPVSKHPAPAAPDAPLGDRHGLLFGGTHVAAGTATAVVVETGARTELGRISALLQGVADLETPLTRSLRSVGRWLTAGVVVTALLLLAVALLRGYPAADALLVAITVAVAAIPEGLPAIITIALAVGVQRMAARRAVVRHLPSVETLGSTTVICTDKTGTLTRNEMTVQALWTPGSGPLELTGVGYAPLGGLVRGGAPVTPAPADVADLLEAAVLCSDATVRQEDGAWRVAGDPTEGALVTAALKLGARAEPLRAAWRRLDAIPFESERQLMATLHADPGGGARLLVKGAPEVVLGRVVLPAGLEAARVLAEVERLAARGMRVLAVAARRLPAPAAALPAGLPASQPASLPAGLPAGPPASQPAGLPASLEDRQVAELGLLGLVGMIDPPRPEAAAAVAACRRAGVRVKMITGDHRGTAEAIGRELGLLGPGEPALTGAALEALDEPGLRRAALETHVFARVAPEHKLRLVRALQAGGQVVAMTGDGVNDAPALKQADVGVAMGIAGTAVAREAADVVLADDDFATLSAAVEEGRRIHDNLVKSLAFVLPTNLGLAIILVAAVLFFPLHEVDGTLAPLLPVLPTQLLWVNLVASVALSLPLAFEVKERDVMSRPPRRPDEPAFGAFVVGRTVLVAVLLAAGATGLFLWEYTREAAALGHEAALREARTMAVTTLVFFQAFYLLNCRSLRESAFRIGFFSNRMVFVGVGLLAVLQAAFTYLPPMQRLFGTAPLDLPSLALAAAAGAIVLPVVSVEKAIRVRAARVATRRTRAA